jgi:TonB family protein
MSFAMQHQPQHRGNVPRRKPAVNLNDTRKESLGEWLYSHRIGLIVVIAVFLIGGIFLATARYDVELRPVEYIIEFVDEAPTAEEVEELKKKRDQLQEDIERRMAAIQQVKNLQSNDAAEAAGSKEQMQYDSDMQQMMDKVASDMATNRGDYESGMREVQGIGKGGSGGGSGGTKGTGDKGKFSGAVTVAYNFDNPVRHHRDLYVPAYRTKSGGVVVVDVWLDRNGTVTSARINSSTNPELNEQALSAARHHRTLFKIDGSAPVSHRGTITYTFVAQ